MKRIGIIAVLLIGLAAITQAQLSFTTAPVKKEAAYANSTNDTTRALRIASANLISLSLTTTDTTAVDVYVQYSKNNSTWTTILTDSIVTTTQASGFEEYSIRDTDSDLIDNVAGWLRTVLVYRASGNGVAGTHKYTLTYNYAP